MLLGAAQGRREQTSQCLEVAHLRWDKRCHQSRAAGLPGAAAAQRLSRRAARNRAYRLIISALPHKEELGAGVPYLHSPPPVPGSYSTGASFLPRNCDGPASFSLMGWRRGAAAPTARRLHSQRGSPGTTAPGLGVCFWGGGGRRLHGSGSASDGSVASLHPTLQPLDRLMLGCPEGCERSHTGTEV